MPNTAIRGGGIVGIIGTLNDRKAREHQQKHQRKAKMVQGNKFFWGMHLGVRTSDLIYFVVVPGTTTKMARKIGDGLEVQRVNRQTQKRPPDPNHKSKTDDIVNHVLCPNHAHPAIAEVTVERFSTIDTNK